MTSKTIGSKGDQQAVLGVLKGVREAWEATDAEALGKGPFPYADTGLAITLQPTDQHWCRGDPLS